MPRRRRFHAFLATLLLAVLAPAPLAAETIRVAVATNFRTTLDALAEHYRQSLDESLDRRDGDRVVISAASTGMLYAQIRAGAPFDLFLAADRERPRRLEADGRIVSGSRRTYARGRLALWAPGREVTGPGEIRAIAPRPLAIADPALAPYGRAAAEVLRSLGIELPPGRLVRGQSIGQAWQFVASGAAAAGLVARSQLMDAPVTEVWIVPATLHEPVEQQLVLLTRKPAAQRFLQFLASPEAEAIILTAGYELP